LHAVADGKYRTKTLESWTV